MKNLNTFFFLLLLLCSTNTFGQKDQTGNMLDYILEEKTHFEHPLKLKGLRGPTEEQGTGDIVLRDGREFKMTHNTVFSLSEGEPMIAVDPNDPNRIALGYMVLSTSLDMPVYHSEDGGETWKKSTFSTLKAIQRDKETSAGTLLGGGDPVLVYDIDGRLWYSYISYTAEASGAKFICWLAYSDNNGGSFKQTTKSKFVGRAKIVNQAIVTNYGNGLLDRQWMVIDHTNGPNRGRHYFSGLYVKKGTLVPQIMVISRDSSEDAFPTQLRPISTATGPQFAHMVIDNNGVLHVIYATIASGEVIYQQSADGGRTFSNPVPVDFMVYNKQAPVKNVQMRENPMPNIAASKDGSVLYASWTDFAGNKAHAYINRSTDGGKTWERAYDVDDFSEFGIYSLMPTIAMNSEDDLVVSWYEIDERLKGQFTMAVKLHNQEKFETIPLFASTETTPFKRYVNNRTVFFGDYFNSTTFGTKTYTAFSDGRKNKGAKLYLAITDHKSLQTKIVEVKDASLKIEEVYPQPSRGSVHIRLNHSINEEVSGEWTGMDGKVIGHVQAKVHDGHLQLQIPSGCVDGVYVLKLSAGDQALTTKVMVGR